jgi:antitoxin component YwqK of YwqJK toxin-antitoxin module
MARILKEEKYPDGSLKSRETELHDQFGQQVILKESWFTLEVDPLNPGAQQLFGRQLYKWNFVNGKKHGLQETWYDNGQQTCKWNFVNGRKNGLQEVWYKNGKQMCKWNYVNGQQHGLQETWYDNGREEYEENYVNGRKHGLQKGWHRNGRQEYEKYYLDDTEVSQQTYQSYVGGLASTIQAIIDFGERGISEIIAGYLLP